MIKIINRRHRISKGEKTETRLLNNFIYWGRDTLNRYTELCKDDNEISSNNSDVLKGQLNRLPKCLVHFARINCNCNQECLDKSLKLLDFDRSCQFINFDDIDDTSEFVDCRYLGNIINSYIEDLDIYIYNLSSDLYKIINYLCNTKNTDPSTLYCKSYILRDICGNFKECIGYFLNQKEPVSCKNPNYDRDIKKFIEILDLSSFDNEFKSIDYIKITEEPILMKDNTNCRKILSLENIEDQKISFSHVNIPLILSILIAGFFIYKKRNNKKLIYFFISLMMLLFVGVLFVNS
jgi:hypothetical protein